MYFSKDVQGNNKQHNCDKVGGIAITLRSCIAHSAIVVDQSLQMYGAFTFR